MSSITLTLTGSGPLLSANFYPEIELNGQCSYSCCLLDFHTYNSIPNVHKNNNKFYFSLGESTKYRFEKITIPVGSYEVSDIGAFLMNNFAEIGVDFSFHANRNTLKCEISTDLVIDFTKDDCIGPLLGYGKRFLKKDSTYLSDEVVKINHLNTIRIDCDLTSGSFLNGKSTHTIHEFSPSVGPGYKIDEQPSNLIYLPITKRRINTIHISVVDQNGDLIDFRGETVTCRLHIKRDE